MRKLTVIGGEGCDPCAVLKEMIEAGEIGIEGMEIGEEFDVEYRDVTKDEDFHLVKELALEHLPAILLDDQRCNVILRNPQGEEVPDVALGDEGVIALISCPPSTPEATSGREQIPS